MDYNKYITASLPDQMEMMFEAIKEQQERLKPENYWAASPADKIQMMLNSIKEEKEKEDSGYYLTASWPEKISFMARQMQEKIKKETEMKISELEFHLSWLEDNKKAVVILLDRVDKNLPNVGNLEEVNDLLDRLIFYLKEMIKKQTALNKLKE